MAEASTTPTQGANKVPQHGDHDRVQMLSLHADGTPDQHNPEIIGDKDAALAAAKRQFAEQAVSAADVEARGVTSGPVTIIGQPGDKPDKVVPATTDATGQDPTVKALTEVHEAAAKAAEAAAEKAVEALSRDS
jgi:hypothetical protein